MSQLGLLLRNPDVRERFCGVISDRVAQDQLRSLVDAIVIAARMQQMADRGLDPQDWELWGL